MYVGNDCVFYECLFFSAFITYFISVFSIHYIHFAFAWLCANTKSCIILFSFLFRFSPLSVCVCASVSVSVSV